MRKLYKNWIEGRLLLTRSSHGRKPFGEYSVVGHDTAASIFDPALEKDNSKTNPISFLFCGIGDARHLMRTIIDVAEHEKQLKNPPRKYHFLINDTNKCVMARDLIIFMLLDELTDLDPLLDGLDGLAQASEKGLEVLTTLYYVYIATMMPKFAFDHLHRVIDKALASLLSRRQPLSIFYIDQRDFSSYITVFQQWKGDARRLFTNVEAIKKTLELLASQTNLRGAAAAKGNLPPACWTDSKVYAVSGFIRSPRQLQDKYDPRVKEKVQKVFTDPWGLVQYISKHWFLNTTLIDSDYAKSLDPMDAYNLGACPLQLAQHIMDEDMPTKVDLPAGLLEFITPIFIDTGKALRILQGRIKIEAVLEDGLDLFETLRFGLNDDQQGHVITSMANGARPKDFPTKFDRIHLSNVP